MPSDMCVNDSVAENALLLVMEENHRIEGKELTPPKPVHHASQTLFCHIRCPSALPNTARWIPRYPHHHHLWAIIVNHRMSILIATWIASQMTNRRRDCFVIGY